MPATVLSSVWACDEDIAVAAGVDWPFIAAPDQVLARGIDGVFASGSPWVLTSASVDFNAYGVAPGNVIALNGPNTAFPQPEFLIVDAVAPGQVTLRRKSMNSGVGQPPGVGGVTGIKFVASTVYADIERASYELNRQFYVDDKVIGRKSGDLYDRRELREACTQLVLARNYWRAARAAGADSDSFVAKAKQAHKEFESLVLRMQVTFLNNYPGNDVNRRQTKLVR